MKNSTLDIKATFNNAVHKLLNPNPIKNRDKWKQKEVILSDAEKIKLFDSIVALDKTTSNELGAFWYKRRTKNRVNKLRVERGYVAKKHTSKAECLKKSEETFA
jgi:hypothetical protein